MIPINYKLILLIHSFSAKEIEQFKKFIISPYFSKGRNYLPFLNHVLKIKANSEKDLEEEKDDEFRELKTFSKQTLRNRFSELYKLGEDFLVIKGLENKKWERNRILLEKLLEKQLYTPYKITFNETLNHAKNEKYDNRKLLNLTKIMELNSVYLQAKNKVDLLYHEYHQSSTLNLCLHLLIAFEDGVEFVQQELIDIKFEPNYLKDYLQKMEISDMMKSFRKSDSIIFKITSMNYYLYKAFENDTDVNNYFECHKIFTEVLYELKDEYKTRFFRALINWCILKQNKGFEKYKEELFKLYNEKLDQNLISDLTNDNYLFNHFRDYVFIGIYLNKFEWVEKFIEKYSPILPSEIRDDEEKISYAKLNFARQKYTKSLSYLENIKKTNYLLYTDSSVNKLCCYLELKIYEMAFLELDKLGHYLRNHKEIPKDHREYTSNFMNFYKKILNLKLEPGRKDTGLLEKELNKIKFITKREWLKEKIRELEN